MRYVIRINKDQEDANLIRLTIIEHIMGEVNQWLIGLGNKPYVAVDMDKKEFTLSVYATKGSNIIRAEDYLKKHNLEIKPQSYWDEKYPMKGIV